VLILAEKDFFSILFLGKKMDTELAAEREHGLLLQDELAQALESCLHYSGICKLYYIDLSRIIYSELYFMVLSRIIYNELYYVVLSRIMCVCVFMCVYVCIHTHTHTHTHFHAL